MDIQSVLQQIGLSKQEVAVYLSTLRLGIAKASLIAQKAGIKREAAYYILKNLQGKGFITEFIRSGVKHYNALAPNLIAPLIQERTKRDLNSFQQALPELKELQKTAITQPKLEFYEGVEGYQAITLKLFQKENQTICGYVPESVVTLFLGFSPHIRLLRQRNNIFLKIITPKTPIFEKVKKRDKQEQREIRFNSLMKNKDVGYYIVPEGVAILKTHQKDHLGIFIEDSQLAELHLSIFEQLWKASK